MKNLIEIFIQELQDNSNVDSLNVYSNCSEYWVYYYSISGFLNDNYFNIYFRSRGLNDAKEIAETTKNKYQIKRLIRKAGL